MALTVSWDSNKVVTVSGTGGQGGGGGDGGVPEQDDFTYSGAAIITSVAPLDGLISFVTQNGLVQSTSDYSLAVGGGGLVTVSFVVAPTNGDIISVGYVV